MQDFVDGVPPPIVKARPTCEVLRKRHDVNPYEQVAIPGGNCVEDITGAVD